MELARVALYVLAINGFLVGLSLGAMLPTVFPGICFGASLALLIGSFGIAPVPTYFPIAGGVLALISAVASVRYVSFRALLEIQLVLFLSPKPYLIYRLTCPF